MHSNQKKFWLSLAFVLAIAAVLGIIPFYLNDWFLTTPDAGGLACGAETLAETGEFSNGRTANLGYNFNICWTKNLYPALQIFHSWLLQIVSVPAWKLVIVTTVGMYLLCVGMVVLIGYRLTDSIAVATYAGLLASASPPLLHALILTPQNLYGYFLLTAILCALVQLVRTKRWWWFMLVIGLAGLLGYTHTLSFGVMGIVVAMWFWGFYLTSWRYRLALVVLAGIGVYIIVSLKVLPISPKGVWELLHTNMFTGYDHPWYDHPALWGYGVTLLASIGLLFPPRLEKKNYWLLICSLVIPLLFGHLSAVGITLMPDRFVAYSWIGVTLFAALGLAQLQTKVRLDRSWFWPIVIIVIGAQMIHVVISSKDDVAGWSARFKPHPEFVDALTWLNQQPDKGLLVGIMAVANREITFAPMWYDGPIASYPWYNLNHRNIKKFEGNSGLYKPIFADPTNPEYLRVKAFYTMLTKPNSDEGIATSANYHVQYLIFPKGSQTDKIWQVAQPEHFQQAYENDRYRLYKLY